jgi:hypothetical protein
MNQVSFTVLFVFVCFASKCGGELLTNQYLVEFHNDVKRETADEIARRNDFVNIGPV